MMVAKRIDSPPNPVTRRGPLAWLAGLIVAWGAAVGCSQSPPAVVSATAGSGAGSAPTVTLMVSAAASLQDVLTTLQPLYEETYPNTTIIYNFASSGSLQQQIEQGAPVDVFLSASPQQMDALDDKGLVLADSRQDVVKNSVVLIAPADDPTVDRFDTLASDQVQRLSIGEPRSVPAGQYGKETLDAQGLYEAIQSKIVFAKDVRQVLSYVETGNVDAGLVYRTDAQRSDGIRIVATAPDLTHSPITYPGAAIADSSNPDAALTFLDFLQTEDATAHFADHGFGLLP